MGAARRRRLAQRPGPSDHRSVAPGGSRPMTTPECRDVPRRGRGWRARAGVGGRAVAPHRQPGVGGAGLRHSRAQAVGFITELDSAEAATFGAVLARCHRALKAAAGAASGCLAGCVRQGRPCYRFAITVVPTQSMMRSILASLLCQWSIGLLCRLIKSFGKHGGDDRVAVTTYYP